MLITVKRNGHGTQTNVDTVHDGEGRVDPCQLFDDDRLGHVIDGRTTVGFGNRDAVETVFEEGLPFFGRGDLVLVSMLHRGRKHRFSEVSHQFSNHLLFVGFTEVHALTKSPNMRSLLTRLIQKNYIFFLSLHIPPVEAAR